MKLENLILYSTNVEILNYKPSISGITNYRTRSKNKQKYFKLKDNANY